MKCPQCSGKMEYKGIHNPGSPKDVREIWECNNCHYIYYRKRSSED